jgi:uncharacterized membrane protein (UPF0182 family)
MAVLAVIVVIVVVGNLWTDWAWYRQLGFSGVWKTAWITRLALFLVFGAFSALLVWLTLRLAKRARPKPSARPRSSLDAYREQLQPIERWVSIALPFVVGFISGAAVAMKWDTFLAWRYQVPFGIEDPQFGMDVSFYVFTLPALTVLLDFALGIAIVCAVLSAFVHLLYGAITSGGRAFAASKSARIQLATLGSIVMVLIGLKIWLGRYSLLLGAGDAFDGANYADVNASIPARNILAGISIVVALMFLSVIARPDWRVPFIGVTLMIVAALVVGGLYPAMIQRFKVDPNAQELEAPYIQRNIDATLVAFGIDDVEITPYDAVTEAQPDALRADAQTTASIRLLDPNIVSPAFQQLQQNKQYYDFRNTLSVDRYSIDGELNDTVIAVRELNLDGLSDENRTWINDRTVFTHGFGVVAAYGNRTNTDGQPTFFEGGIPSHGELGDYEPRIYFGPGLPNYSIVGAPEGLTPWELDYPDDASTNGQVNTTYEADGGPGIGNTFAKLMFWVRFGDEEILFSDRVTSESQILYVRDPVERVQKVAPYLTLDQNTYPAVVDGRVLWVVDGFTVTSHYPYADRLPLGLADGSEYQLTYLRNSVKATVDAYDGTVTLYAWDPEDPILQTWSRVYPGTLTPVSEISSQLMSHLRYPELLFRIQRLQIAHYHVTDAQSFYSGQDFWRNPEDPTTGSTTGGVLQPPYYLTLQMPGQSKPTFSMMSSFIPGGNTDRNVLTGYLAVNSETGSIAGHPDPDYGTLRLLELPRDSTVPGPGQVQNAFNSDPEAQNILNLLRQGETTVLSGNLLTLPVGGGLLYVQPVFVQSSQGTQFPLLRKVFVAFGDSVGFGDTLDEALDQVFGAVGPTEPTEPDNPTNPSVASEARVALQNALSDAKQAIEDGQAALAEGDFAAYGEAQDRLAEALDAAIAAEALIVEAESNAEEAVAAL